MSRTQRLALVAAAICAAAPTVSAEVDPRGTFTTSIPIDVPPFYAIAPRLALGYQDGGGHFAGVGWDLVGASVITRTSATRGTPRFEITDRFYLDGEELVACLPGSTSPSCTTAMSTFGWSDGFFSTRIDQFLRIGVDGEAGIWTVWERDGTVRMYWSGDGGLSYQLHRVTDTHGNRVTYAWRCQSGAPPCVLDAIRYGGTALGPGIEILFYREARPDVWTASTGRNRAAYAERLRSVVIKSHGSLLRAYQLGYDLSQETGASILTSVQQFASDATVDPSGAITPGPTPPLPATQLRADSLTARGSWQLSAEVATASLLDVSAPPASPLPPHYTSPNDVLTAPAGRLPATGTLPPGLLPFGALVGDFDGDGRSEVLAWGMRSLCSTIATSVRLSTSSGVASSSPVTSQVSGGARIPITATTCKVAAHVADVDGDGRDDLVMAVEGELRVLVARGDGGFADGGTIAWTATNNQCSTGDVDGDGRTDLVCEDGAAHRLRTYRASPAGWQLSEIPTDAYGSALNLPDHAGLQLAVADVDGDGLADVVMTRPNGSSTRVVIGISRGTGSYAWENHAFPNISSPTAKLVTPDLDGDGRVDLVLLEGSTIYAAISRKGDLVGRFEWMAPYTSPLLGPSFADVDGDGRADLIGDASNYPGDELSIQLALPGGGFGPVIASDAECDIGDGPPMVLAADLDGDGLADPMCIVIGGDDFDHSFTIVDRRSQPRGTDRHRWFRADVDGDGRLELVYVAFMNPGYTVYVVSPRTQSRTAYPVPRAGLVGLVEPDRGRWLTADVGSQAGTADGKADLVLVEDIGGALWTTTLLSTGLGTFQPVQTPLVDALGNAAPDPAAPGWIPVDLDGDGMADLARIRPNGAAPGIILDTVHAIGGGRFGPVASETHFDTSSSAPMWDRSVQAFRPTDVDGDGLTDFVHISVVAGADPTIRTLRARAGGGFDEVATSPAAAVIDPVSWRTADIDGDGNADLVHVTRFGAGCIEIVVEAGDGAGGFAPSTLGGSACVAPTVAADPTYSNLFDDSRNFVLADLDGDRRPELIHVTHQLHASQASLLVVTVVHRDGSGTWSAAVPATWTPSGDVGDSWSWQPSFDPESGDAGLAYIAPSGGFALRWQRVPDELVSIDNGVGLTTTIAREPFLDPRGYLPSGMVPRVVWQVAVADAAYTPPVADHVEYHYTRPRWSDRDRRMIGFETMRADDGRTVKYDRFTLDDACGARAWQREVYDQSYRLFGYSVIDYVAPGAAAPYRCLVAVTRRHECEPGSSCRLAEQVETDHDAYGNTIAVRAAADRATPTGIAQPVGVNTAAYIVDRVSYRLTVAWTGTEWTPRALRLYYYDDDLLFGAPGAHGDVTSIDDWDDTREAPLRTTMAYDAAGNLIETTTPGGKHTMIQLDPIYQRFPYVICASGPTTELCTVQSWDLVLGQVHDTTDPNGGTTTTSRDPHGRVTEVSGPSGTTRTSYLGTGRIAGRIAARQRVRIERVDGSANDNVMWSESFYDGSGRTYRTTREGGATVTTSYGDASSRPAAISDVHGIAVAPQQWTTYLYDELGRSTAIVHPDGTRATTAYQLGQVTATDELGARSVRRLDGRGAVVEVDEIVGGTTATTHYAYDAFGRLTTITDASNNVTTMTWSSVGRLFASSDPDRGKRSFWYEPDGELRTQRDGLDQEITYSYDSLGRVIGRIDSDGYGKTDREVTWTYDDAMTHGASRGRLIQIDDRQAATSVSTELWYDLAGRPTRLHTCLSGRCMDEDRAYDPAGRIATLTYPDATGSTAGKGAEKLAYLYDDAGHLVEVGSYAKLSYELDGRLHDIQYANGVTSVFSYDPVRRWLDRLDVNAPTTTLLSIDYEHDAAGRITRQLATGAQQADLSYRYDELGRLYDVQSPDPLRREHMAYDAIGRLRGSNRLSDVRYDDPLHVHAATSTDLGATRTYDANGNVIKLSDPSGRELGVSWTADGHVAGIEDGARKESYQFGYDTSGRRVEKSGPAGTSRYFSPQLELDPKGRLIKYYTAGDLLIARNDGDVYYFHSDVAHATRLETDSGGKLANSYEYWSSGEPYRVSEAVDHDIGFSGARSDDSLGLIAMGARVYDPVIGRFLSADSVIPNAYRPQSLDRYSYVENDAINHWDPSGHAKLSVEIMMERKQLMRSLQVKADAGADCSMFSGCESWMTGASNLGRSDFYSGMWLRGPSLWEQAMTRFYAAVARGAFDPPEPSAPTEAVYRGQTLGDSIEPQSAQDAGVLTDSATVAKDSPDAGSTGEPKDTQHDTIDKASGGVADAQAKVDAAKQAAEQARRDYEAARDESASQVLDIAISPLTKIHKIPGIPKYLKRELEARQKVDDALEAVDRANEELGRARQTLMDTQLRRHDEYMKAHPSDPFWLGPPVEYYISPKYDFWHYQPSRKAFYHFP